MNTKRKWDVLTDAERRRCLESIIQTTNDSLTEEEIGLLTAEDVFNEVMNAVASKLYEKGVNDAKQVIESKHADALIDIDLLS